MTEAITAIAAAAPVVVTGILAIFTYQLWQATLDLATQTKTAATEQATLTAEAIDLCGN